MQNPGTSVTPDARPGNGTDSAPHSCAVEHGPGEPGPGLVLAPAFLTLGYFPSPGFSSHICTKGAVTLSRSFEDCF